MSQTVEFEYAIGDTVKITENGPALGCLGIVEVRKQGRTRIQYNVAYPADMSLSSYANRRWFDECYLAPRASAGSTESKAPAFPRVTWQGQTKNGVQRIVESSHGCTESEGQGPNDAMGVPSWHRIPWQGSLAEAFATLVTTVGDGSNQTT